MKQILLIGVGAGAASALLSVSVLSGSGLSLFLTQLAPLPILIAALGWSHWAGLVAALVAAVGLGAVLGFSLFAVFLIGVGFPAWWLGYLALLARPSAANGSGDIEWYPIGRLVLWSALIATMMVAWWMSNFGTDKEALQAGLRSAFERAIRLQSPSEPDQLARPELRSMVDYLVGLLPLAAAAISTLMNAFNLWLAGRIVLVSGRLRRPWPDVSSMTLPPHALGLLAAAIAGSFLPDLLGIIAGVLAAALFTAYAMQGFAVLHVITRGTASRGFALAGAYAVVVAFSYFKWPVIAMSLLGLAESAFNIRARFAVKSGPPSAPT